LLKTEDGIVRVAEDRITGTYSIGLRTPKGIEWKSISKTLHNLLVNELSQQQGNTLK
jgi:glucose/arabinose dehydrogenase